MTQIQGEFSLIALMIGIDGKAHFWNTHHMSYPLIHNSINAPKESRKHISPLLHEIALHALISTVPRKGREGNLQEHPSEVPRTRHSRAFYLRSF